MFGKILIANRGEIACRIARTARRMGVQTVAVYSDADRDALHVAQCDEAVFIGPAAPVASYLCARKIIDAALVCNAQAVHPGYGFLSENPDFAEACAERGIVFIGPPADAIRAMGGKSRAKDIMAQAGVPVAAGYHGEDQRAETLQAAADDCGYPLLIKAVGGGGGKGMRLVEDGAGFADALAAVKREAAGAFADERVLLEKYLPRARHVEVQVFADRHGNTLHLFERDCSIQRRHQKVIEESPAPGINDELRERMGGAAVAAAKAIDYVGAGTVEFLLDADARFYFIEMNTRLQVEHAVTEMVTGQDLVEWQLRVASGEPLPCGQHDLRIDGHAMEARIYAENPANDFLPSAGNLAVYREPPASGECRVDSGVRAGDDIQPCYDPLLAKLIVWGHDRESARRRLRAALAEFDIAGIATNLGFLHALTELGDFITPALDTAFIERNCAALFADDSTPADVDLAIAALFELHAAAADDGEQNSGDPFSPWSPGAPWQLNLPTEAACRFATESGAREYRVRYERGRSSGVLDGERTAMALTPCDNDTGGGRFQFQYGERRMRVSVHKVAGVIHINRDGRRCALSPAAEMRAGGEHASDAAAGSATLSAPMPGTVIALAVGEGQLVRRGAPLLALEAMKMEHTISAPCDGRVARLFVRRGEQVREGERLLTLEPAEGAD